MNPSTVGITTSDIATVYPFQRKCFYANGLFWVFYADGTNLVYSTSPDGVTWTVGVSSPIRACTQGSRFSIWFDGTYIYYAYCFQSAISFRRGATDSTGKITWSAAAQSITGTLNANLYPFVTVDSAGYPWITYFDGAYVYVVASSKNDGTWTTVGGFPYKLSATSNGGWKACVIPLTLQKMAVVYNYDAGATIKLQSWTGSAWNAEVATVAKPFASSGFSAVAQGDSVHLVFEDSYNTIYTEYIYSTNSFTAETTIVTGPEPNTSAPVLSIDSSNNLYCFWQGYPTAYHLYYKKYTAATSTWDTNPTDWAIEVNLVGPYNSLTSFYQSSNGYIGLEYESHPATPYIIRFAVLSFNIVRFNEEGTDFRETKFGATWTTP